MNRQYEYTSFTCSEGHPLYTTVVVVVDSHIQRVVPATEATTVRQPVSHIDLSNANPAHHGDNPLLKPTGIQIATKPLPGPTNREHRKLETYRLFFLAIGGLHEDKLYNIYRQWHRPMSKRFIKTPHSISRATSIDSGCCRLPIVSVLSNKVDKSRSNQS